MEEVIVDIAEEKKLAPSEIRNQVLEVVTQLITIGLLRPEEALVLPLHQ